MKEALVFEGPKVTIHDTPVPVPSSTQVLTRVYVSGTNPKDWKLPEWAPDQNGTNQGDDIAGVVAAVGSAVTQFKVGDRVAAFHEMRTPHGSYAEYAISPETTTFHIPRDVSFEQAATIPLAALTAAVALFSRLGLPERWQASPSRLPAGGLLIYGAATAVGAFAVQLASHAGIHPLICVAGNGIPFVESLVDPSKGDVVLDYRSGNEALVTSIRAAIPQGEKLLYGLDCVAEKAKSSFSNIFQVLDHARGQLSHVLPLPDSEVPADVGPEFKQSWTSVGSVHDQNRDLGYVWSRLFEMGLKDGWFRAHPFEVVPGGLAGVQKALTDLKAGKASAVKYVLRIGDTDGVDLDPEPPQQAERDDAKL